MSAATPVGGKVLTRPFVLLLALAAASGLVMLWRFYAGLGVTTAMNDGYPWGIWIAFDVVTGTAIGAGGYTMALLIYVLNRGQYHPLVRPAMVTTALGYTIAGFSIVLDVGRWWNIWRIPIQVGDWNLNSALLEVALCVMAYMTVAWLEVGDSVLEGLSARKDRPGLARKAARVRGVLRRALPFVIAAGVLLPTMHQSSLGSLLLLTSKLDPLWHTPMLPLLFLVSCIAMGFGGVILESSLSAKAFHRTPEWPLLERLARVVAWIVFGFLALRLGDVLVRGAFATATPFLTLMFLVEFALFLVPALLLATGRGRDPGVLFVTAVSLILAGALYRFDTYLVAFDPGRQWSYFPSIPEMFITVGLVAIELAVYVFIVKRFPILSGRHADATA